VNIGLWRAGSHSNAGPVTSVIGLAAVM
jgi:hypothetical protein